MAVLGTIKGQMVLDVKQALAAYTSVRQDHVSTVTALQTGAGALTTAGATMAGAGIAMGAGFVYAANKAGEFERKLDYFSAVSDSTQAEYDMIREKALQLGADTIYSADQIAESFVELGKAGVPAQDIVDGIGEAVANLGAAADIPLDTASNIIMAAVQTFGLSADHAVGVADKLAGAANASIIDVQDLGVSLKYAGGVARTLGMDFDEVNTAIALLGQYGIKGSTAGTSLRQMLVSLTGKTKPATKTLKELGIITEDGTNKFFDANGEAKSLSEIFQILQDATADLTAEQRLNALRTIFQNRALAAAAALTEEGADGFASMYDAIGKTTAMDVANERLDNLSGDLEILRGNIETLVIDTGSKFQQFARQIVQGLTSMIQWFADLPDGVQNALLGFAAFVAVGLTLLGFFGMFAGAVLNIIAFFLKLAPVLSLISKGITLVRGAMLALSTAFFASPIGWIVLGITALVAAFVLLWNNVEGFRNFWIGVWQHIKNAANAVWVWIQGLPAWFAGVWQQIQTTVSTVWNAIITFFQTLPTRIGTSFIDMWNWMQEFWANLAVTLNELVANVVNGVVTFFSELPGRISEFMSELPEMIGYWLGFALGKITRWAIDSAIAIAKWATDTYDAVVKWFQALPGKIATFLVDLYNRINTWFTNMLTKAVTIATNIYNGVVDWFQKLPGRVISFVTNMAKGIATWMENARNTAITVAGKIFNGIVNALTNLPARIVTFFTNLANGIRDKLTQAVSYAVSLGADIASGVVDGIQKLPGAAKDIFNKVVRAIKDKVTAAFNAVKDFAAGLWNGFKKGLGINSPSYIEHAIWAITDTLDVETQRMKQQVRAVQNLGNGISEVGNNLGFDTDGLTRDLNAMSAQVQAVKNYKSELSSLGATTTLTATPTSVATVAQAMSQKNMMDKLAQFAQQSPNVTQQITIPMPAEIADSAARFFGWVENIGVEAHASGSQVQIGAGG